MNFTRRMWHTHVSSMQGHPIMEQQENNICWTLDSRIKNYRYFSQYFKTNSGRVIEAQVKIPYIYVPQSLDLCP